MSSTATREQILQAATQLFAERGIAATSIRQIVSAAGVNVAAVHYHFGSKDELVLETFRNFISEVNCERLSRLDELETQYPNGIPVKDILDALLRPVVLYCSDESKGGSYIAKLMGRAHTEADEKLRQRILSELEIVIQRFLSALKKSMPDYSMEDLGWGFFFTIGAMAFTLIHSGLPDKLREAIGSKPDIEVTIARLVSYVEAGICHGRVRAATEVAK